MKNKPHPGLAGLAAQSARGLLAVLALSLGSALLAASTDIANTPIYGTAISQATPNIMLLMDTSKSILFTHAPNALEGTSLPPPAAQPIGYRANQCNSIYYNPATVYELAADGAGAKLPLPAFAAAPYNYFTPSGNVSSPNGRASVDLNSQFQAFDRNTRARNAPDANDPEQRAYYYVYTPTAGLTPATLPYAAAPCTDAYDPALYSVATTGGHWQRVLVGDPADPSIASKLKTVLNVPQDERQNFANWYTYYRTRVALTKSGFGRAFDHLTNEFRVGLINGNPLERASTDAKPPVDAKVDSAAYLALGGFTAEHKKDWYTKLYAQVPGGSSPMREGLARVGRHYANKDDLINKGMTLQSATDDHSCRQNFTIMTTGGYWSQFAETRGAVQIDGTSLVGQQDGVIDAKVTVDGATYDISPRPIWDGGTTGKRITTDKWNDYRSFSCLTNQVTMSTAQTLAATVQKKQSSSQITTSQKTQTRSTHQMQQSTEQDVQQTLQTLKTTRQGKAHTVVFTLSTSQATKTVSYAIAYVTTPTQRTHQRLKTTSSTLKTTSQFKVSSSQLQVSTSQAQKTTQTTTKTTSQLRQSTSQLQLSSTQPNRTTTQFTRSTSQLLQTTDQSTASTSQWWATSSQNSTPVPSCTPSTEITCTHVTTPAIPVALDTTGVCSAPPSSGLSTWTVLGSANNGYIDTICVNIHTGPVGVLVCGTSTPLQTVACTLVKTGPTPMYRCIPPTFDAQAVDWGSGYAYNYDNYLAPGKTYGQGGPADQYAPHGGTAVYPDALWYQQNNNTTTTCGTVSTGPTPVDSCTNTDATSANAWTAITCTAVTTGPTPAKICNQGTDANYVTTTCNTVTTGPTGVSSCTESGSASVDPYLVTTCDTATSSTPVAPADCTAGTDANYVVTTCPTITTGPTPVKAGDCTEGTVGAVTTTCPVATTGPTPVASCSGSGDVNVSPYLVTSCHTVITGPTGVSGCTASGSASVDPYLQIFCDHPTSSSTVAPADCTAGTDVNYVVTTCTPTTLGPTPVPAGDCTEGTVGAVTTSCSFNDSAFTAVESCTPSTGPGPDYIDIECGTSTGYGNGAQVCVEGPGVVCEQHTFVEPTTTPCVAPPPSAPWWTTTVCNPPTVTGPTPVYSCTEGVTGSDTVYPYLVSTCVKTPGPSNYTPQPCSDVFGTSPDYVHKVCEIPVDTGPLGVQTGTCIADPGTSAPYLKVECTAPVTTWKPVAPGSCQLQKQVADETNGWKTINCDTQPTGPTLATSIDGTTFNCTTAPATEPLWTRTTCTPVDEGPTAVDPTDPTSCASAISAGLTKTTVCSTSQTPPVAQNATSCAGLDVAATEPNWVATVCSTVPTGPTPADPVACEAAKLIQPSPGNGYVTTTCDTFTTPATPVAACTAYTVGGPGTTPATDLAHQYTSTTCSSNPTDPTPVAATLCTAYTVGGLGTTPETDLAHQYTSTTCTTLPGRLVYYVTTEKITTATVSGGQVVTDPPATVTTSIVTAGGYYSAYLDNPAVCYTQAQQPTLFATAPAFSAGGEFAPERPPKIPTTVPTERTSVEPAPTSPCLAWPCVKNISGNWTGGSSNSLADVAQYYYATDLRPDLMDNVYIGTGTGPEDDRLRSQHMTTFVVGLGVSGTLAFTPDYLAGSGDFSALRTGEKVPGQGTGATNWPVWPTLLTTNDWQFNDARSIDDFWHAAVNGRGRLFSAKDPDSLVFGIKGALSGAESTSGAGAGAVSATVTAAASGNEIFTTGFTTSKWTGDVQSRTFTAAGINDNVAPRWSAQEKLVARVADECDLRNIRLIRVGDSENNNLAPFTWDTQACDPSTGLPTGVSHTSLSAAEQTLFGESVTNSLSQFETGGTATQAQRAAAGGAALVNFLRGQRGRAGYIAGDVGHLFRTRESVGVLGDIVNSQLAYVGAPSLEYTDADYDSFKTEQAARKPMAYVGANDGMLHAFYAPKDPSTDAKAGKEAWAVIPTPVLPNLYRLADVAYGSHHAFFVDGSPTTGDVCISEGTACSWKTILVGGLDSGGKGYYALDITNPDDPKALWEFKASSSGSDCATSASAAVGQSVDCNLGLSYGRPVITKLANGTWVVLVASGYNNNSGAGDGQGYLYVLNAGTGKIIRRIGTGAGDSTTPSGLRELTTYMSNPAQNNQATRVYGGDLLGNLWRFDINDASASAVRITTLTASNGTPTNGTASSFTAQPITTRINLVEINGNTFLLVGTGRMLGKSDFTDTQQQSVYSIKDPLTTPTGSDAAIDPTKLRAGLRHVVLSKSGSVLAKNLKRTATCTGSTAECASTGGWYLDLTEPGERVSIDMGLAFGTLAFQSNVPDSSACSNGTNLFNYIDFVSGKSVYDNGLVTELGGSALAVGSSLISFGPGPGVCPLVQMVTNADGSVKGTCVPLGPVPTLGRRVSWREIVN